MTQSQMTEKLLDTVHIDIEIYPAGTTSSLELSWKTKIRPSDERCIEYFLLYGAHVGISLENLNISLRDNILILNWHSAKSGWDSINFR
jgi:hypothetical protein